MRTDRKAGVLGPAPGRLEPSEGILEWTSAVALGLETLKSNCLNRNYEIWPHPPPGLWILACIDFLRNSLAYYGFTMYLDMGFTKSFPTWNCEKWLCPSRRRILPAKQRPVSVKKTINESKRSEKTPVVHRLQLRCRRVRHSFTELEVSKGTASAAFHQPLA